MHSVLFLVMNFLFVAALYVLLGAPFLAVIQILVYAGGIVVLYLFVVMLVNLKRPPEAHQDPHRHTGVRLLRSRRRCSPNWSPSVSTDSSIPARCADRQRRRFPSPATHEQVGWLLYTSYLIPFEIASMLLLVAMIER